LSHKRLRRALRAGPWNCCAVQNVMAAMEMADAIQYSVRL
jgi:hypothetical protein